MKLDFSKVKHIKTEGDCSTFSHKDGHEIKIMHKALSKAHRKQLEEMVGSKEEPVQKMASGGMLQRPDEPQEEQLPEIDIMKGVPTVEESMAAPPADPLKDETISRYNQMIQAQGTPNFQDSLITAGTPGAAGINTDAWAEARQQAELSQSEKAAEKNKPTPEQQKAQEAAIALEKQNQARQQMGLEPLPGAAPQSMNEQPSALNQQQAQMTAQPESKPATPSAPQSGIDTQIAGINMQAAALGKLGQEQAALQNQYIQTMQTAKQDFESRLKSIDADSQNYMKDIQEGYIDPNKYWEGWTTANGKEVPGKSRVAAAIGMILAGFNPTSRPNAVQEMLDKEIDRSMDAQKTNLQSSHNLLRANMDKFKNLYDAQNMTRIMLNDSLQAQLQAAAAKAQSPLAKAAAMQAIGPLQQQKAKLTTQIALNQSINKLMTDPNASPQAMNEAFDMLAQVDPDKAKDLRSRYVPGLGAANTAEGAKGLKELQAFTNTSKESIAGLRRILNTPGKSLSLGQRKEAELLRSLMVGPLKDMVVSTGTMSESDKALILSTIPEVANLFSLDSNSKKSLDVLERQISNVYSKTAKANGIQPPAQQAQPLRMFDKAKGKVSLWDPNNKKFLGYEP